MKYIIHVKVSSLFQIYIQRAYKYNYTSIYKSCDTESCDSNVMLSHVMLSHVIVL